MSIISVVLVEDNPLHAQRYRENLALDPTLALVGEFSLAADAIAGIGQLAPDVVLVDLGLPDASGLEVVRHVRAWLPATALMVVSIFGDERNLVLLCALVYALADAYFRTYDQLSSLNADLERRVGERALELQRTHLRVRALERVTTLAGERERLMRDMHDGIGSQLMTTLDAVERGGHGADDVAAMLRDCIDDLRLMIDSLEPGEESLLVALANLRYRLEPRLAAAGIALDWQAHLRVCLQAPGSVLQVLRIAQEAVNNVLKHARASRLRICTRADAGDLVLEVEDDAGGIDLAAAAEPAASKLGRGLGNMRSRAASLGATLHLSSTAQGTRLTLRIPMAAQPAAV